MQSPVFRGFVVLWYFGGMEELISKDISFKNVWLTLLAGVLVPVVIISIPFALKSYENSIEVSGKGITVNGYEGFDLSWKEITNVSLVGELPEIENHNKTLKGNFKSRDGSDLKMVINGDAPYIRIEIKIFEVYLNQYYQKDTRKVFQEIQE